MTSTPEFRHRTEVAADQPAPGVHIRSLVRGPALELVEYTVPKGFVAGGSDHPVYEKAGYVVRGQLEIAVAGSVHVVQAGGAYALPRGLPHRFTVLEDATIVQVRSADEPAPGSANGS